MPRFHLHGVLLALTVIAALMALFRTDRLPQWQATAKQQRYELLRKQLAGRLEHLPQRAGKWYVWQDISESPWRKQFFDNHRSYIFRRDFGDEQLIVLIAANEVLLRRLPFQYQNWRGQQLQLLANDRIVKYVSPDFPEPAEVHIGAYGPRPNDKKTLPLFAVAQQTFTVNGLWSSWGGRIHNSSSRVPWYNCV